jgi:hypothetical protein
MNRIVRRTHLHSNDRVDELVSVWAAAYVAQTLSNTLSTRWFSLAAGGRCGLRSRSAEIRSSSACGMGEQSCVCVCLCGLRDSTGKLWGLLESTDEETRRDCVVEDGRENGAGHDGYREEAYV